VWNIVVHGKDILEVVLVREDVNHPRKDLGQKGSSFGIARFLSVDRTEHAEFRVFAEIFLELVCGGSAKIRLLVPPSTLSGMRSLSSSSVALGGQ
jgi:hypothetical protein